MQTRPVCGSVRGVEAGLTAVSIGVSPGKPIFVKGKVVTTRTRARDEAMRASIESISQRLEETLGQQMTAYAVGVRDPRALGRYAHGERAPVLETEKRLRQLFEITQLLLARETPETLRAWMLGSHPSLDDRSPVELLHGDGSPASARTASDGNNGHRDAHSGYLAVVRAAEEFVRVA
jgi:hypothetical protein